MEIKILTQMVLNVVFSFQQLHSLTERRLVIAKTLNNHIPWPIWTVTLNSISNQHIAKDYSERKIIDLGRNVQAELFAIGFSYGSAQLPNYNIFMKRSVLFLLGHLLSANPLP